MSDWSKLMGVTLVVVILLGIVQYYEKQWGTQGVFNFVDNRTGYTSKRIYSQIHGFHPVQLHQTLKGKAALTEPIG